MNLGNTNADAFWNDHLDAIKSIVTTAYLDGYQKGLSRSKELTVNGVSFYDLGLPSGTLWSQPATIHNIYSYVTYDLKSYSDVADCGLPTIDDLNELIANSIILLDNNIASKDVIIVGSNGGSLSIGTEDYLNRSDNPISVKCLRRGEKVAPGVNKFWLLSDVENNMAQVGMVDFNNCTISKSSNFTGLRLPYLLVMKP